ncbi:DNA-dependent DNA polymerase [reindeer adenovirus 1]|uniref:DNA polymerase n=1 Tax=reindeer adenovirus 1 TaxID=2885353 RepID=A0AAE9C112_9ADEN|nr:DNA-dependent DNA polymerase [reindeer adenovirus 1]
MALVQGDGTRGLHAAPRDPEDQPQSGAACLGPAPAAAAHAGAQRPRAAPAAQAREAAAPARPPPRPLSRRTPRGALVAKRSTLRLHGQAEDGATLEVKYHADLTSSLQNLFDLHLLPCPVALKPQDVLTFRDTLTQFCNPDICVYRAYKGRLKTTSMPARPEAPKLPFPLNFLIHKKRLYLIESIAEVQRCQDCGYYFKQSHTCTTRRRDFYYHHVSTQSADWWEEIKFFPLGAHPDTRRLFVVYDVETYTWHGSFGKQLVPFMLVFTLFGDSELCAMATQIAKKQNWCAWPKQASTFFYLNPQRNKIGSLFKQFRDALQEAACSLLWQTFLTANPFLEELTVKQGHARVSDIPFSELCKLRLSGEPSFLEIYVIGHNINGFDEIVLAAQVINNKQAIPPAFKVSRNFMPRCGKILFNDLTFALPNPAHAVRKDFADWEQGVPTSADYKVQFVKFMVRDTFALTHTSLRKAAAAYALPVEKGSCPYKAVNEFYMLGTYRTDEDSFPQKEYWSSDEEYFLNKSLWLQENTSTYDIVQRTLDYCALDVLVTAELVKKLQQSYLDFVHNSVGLPLCHFNVLQRPTISSNSHAIFRQVVYRAQRPNKASLGTFLLAPSNEMYAYIRESIRGGRCYPTYIGVLPEPIYVYDICGMYASALTHPFPAGKPLNPFDRALAMKAWQDRLDQMQVPISYFDETLLPAVFTIDADPPSESHLDVLPPFCSRKGGRLCWTNESLRGEVVTCLDAITLHNRGWRVQILNDPRTTVFPRWECLARDYVQLNIAAKERADKEKNQTLRSIAKLLSNALYGSFATKLDNRVTVFSDQMEEKYVKGISDGTYDIKGTAFVETDNLSASVMAEMKVAYSPPKQQTDAKRQHRHCTPSSNSSSEDDAPFYSREDPQSNHVTYTYKPIMFLDADDSALCLHTLEKKSPLIFNNRYPSHIASFVLAWTRAFVSEWADILYLDDRGTPLEERTLKFVYGDTDSMFLTQAGKELMDARGKHRLKGNGRPLVFDPSNPSLTWLVECETQCERCRGDAHSQESVFLAPKLYALKNIYCPLCQTESSGKLRAKGHATSQLSYDLLVACYHSTEQLGAEKYSTSRLSLKRSLVSRQPHQQPFTVTETTLARTLRPWKDRTLRSIDRHLLAPYSNSHPNPRNKELCWMEIL